MKKWKVKKRTVLTCIFICMIVLIGVISFSKDKSEYSNKINNNSKSDANTGTNAYKNRSRKNWGDRFQLFAYNPPLEFSAGETEGTYKSVKSEKQTPKIAASGFTTVVSTFGWADDSGTAEALDIYNSYNIEVYERALSSDHAFGFMGQNEYGNADNNVYFNSEMKKVEALIKNHDNLTGLWSFDEGYGRCVMKYPQPTDPNEPKCTEDNFSTTRLQERAKEYANYINSTHPNVPSIFNNFPNFAEAINENMAIWTPDTYENYIRNFHATNNIHSVGAKYIGIDHYNFGLKDNHQVNFPNWYKKYVEDLALQKKLYDERKAQGKYTITQPIILVSPRSDFPNITKDTIVFQINSSFQFGGKNIGYFAFCSGDNHIGISNCRTDLISSMHSDNTMYNDITEINQWVYNLGTELYKRDLKVVYNVKAATESTDSEFEELYSANTCNGLYLPLTSTTCNGSLLTTYSGSIKSIGGNATLSFFDDGSWYVVNPNIDAEGPIFVEFGKGNLEYFDPEANVWKIAVNDQGILGHVQYKSDRNGVYIYPGYGVWVRRNDFSQNIRSNVYVVNNARYNVMVYANTGDKVTDELIPYNNDQSFAVTNLKDGYLTSISKLKVLDKGNEVKQYSLSGVTSELYDVTPSYIYTGQDFDTSKITILGSSNYAYDDNSYDHNKKYSNLKMNLYIYDNDYMKRIPIVTFKSDKYDLDFKENLLVTNGSDYNEEDFYITNAYAKQDPNNSNKVNFYLEGSGELIDTVTIVKSVQSSENRLSSLTVSSPSGYTITPNFNKDTKDGYTLSSSVPNSVTQVVFNATPLDSKASIVGTSNKCSLTKTGNNTCQIGVQAEDTTVTYYTITVTREEAATTPTVLNHIVIQCSKNDVSYGETLFKDDFNPTTYTYNVNYPSICGTKWRASYGADGLASTTENFTIDRSETNTTWTQVIAQNYPGYSGHTYTIKLNLKSTVSSINSLSISSGTINEPFSSSSTGYTATVPANTSSVTFTYVRTDDNKTYTKNCSLTADETVCEIPITSQYGGKYSTTYTVTVTKEASQPVDNAFVEWINVEYGSFSKRVPNVSSNVTGSSVGYSLDVPDTLLDHSITVTYKIIHNSTIQTKMFNFSSAVRIVTLTVKSSDELIERNYNVTLVPKSTDNELKSFTVDGQSFTLTGAKEYTIKVREGISTVNVKATKHSKATFKSGVDSNGEKTWSTAQSQTITIQSEAGDSQDYKFNFQFLSTDNELKSLTVNGQAFTLTGAKEYTINVEEGTSTVNVKATKHSKATFKSGVDSNGEKSWSTSQSQTIVIQSEAGTSETYKFNFYFQSADRELKSFKVGDQTISLTGSQPYMINVNEGVSTVSVTATKHAKATYKSGIATTGTDTWTVDSNTRTIVVRSESGKEASYQFKFNVLSTDNELKSLTVNGQAFTLTGAKEYTINVEEGTSTVNVKATKHSKATFKSGVDSNGEKSWSTSQSQTIVIQSEAGTSETYKYNFYFQSADRELKSFKVGDQTISLTGSQPYMINVNEGISSVSVTATKHSKATFKSGINSSGTDTWTVDSNTRTIVVRSESGKEASYQFKFNVQSTDNELKSLTIDGQAFTLTGAKEYTINVEEGTSTVNVKATKHSKATFKSGVDSNGEKSWSTSQSQTIVIQSEAGTSETYKFNFNIQSSDNALKSLKIGNQTVTITGAKTYSVTVPYETTSVSVTSTKHSKATFSGDVSASGTATWDNLTVGENPKTITITSEYGRSQSYTIKVDREKSKNADLKSLSLSAGTLNREFNKTVYNYTSVVEYSVTSVTLTGVKDFDDQTVTSTCKNLVEGVENTCSLVVTAPYGNINTYQVKITRKKSNDKTLKSLGLEGFNLDSPLTSGVTEYDVTVPYTTKSVKVVAQANINVATLTYDTVDHTISLTNEITTYHVKVTAQNEEEQTYTLTIKRVKNKDATLKS